MDKYKENNIRITKMYSPEWRNSINTLKTLECDNEKKDYYIVYKKESQRKNRKFKFHSVRYVEETNSFLFTQYKISGMNCDLTKEVSSIETIMDIEIDIVEITDKFDWSNYISLYN